MRMGRAGDHLNTTKNPRAARLTVVVPERVQHKTHSATKAINAAAEPSFLSMLAYGPPQRNVPQELSKVAASVRSGSITSQTAACTEAVTFTDSACEELSKVAKPFLPQPIAL